MVSQIFLQKLHNSKQSQIIIIAAFLVFSALLFLYSLETQNYYNTNSQKIDIDSTIHLLFCEHITQASGLNLNSSLVEFENSFEQYCNHIDSLTCNVNIIVSTNPPGGNFSLLNFTHLSLNYSTQYYTHNNSNIINCQ